HPRPRPVHEHRAITLLTPSKRRRSAPERRVEPAAADVRRGRGRGSRRGTPERDPGDSGRTARWDYYSPDELAGGRGGARRNRRRAERGPVRVGRGERARARRLPLVADGASRRPRSADRRADAVGRRRVVAVRRVGPLVPVRPGRHLAPVPAAGGVRGPPRRGARAARGGNAGGAAAAVPDRPGPGGGTGRAAGVPGPG